MAKVNIDFTDVRTIVFDFDQVVQTYKLSINDFFTSINQFKGWDGDAALKYLSAVSVDSVKFLNYSDSLQNYISVFSDVIDSLEDTVRVSSKKSLSSKASFNSDKMNTTISILEKAIKGYGSAISSSSSLDIPSFSYSGWLTALPDKLGSLRKSCDLDIDWAKSVITQFENFNSECISQIEKIDVPVDFTKIHNINIV